MGLPHRAEEGVWEGRPNRTGLVQGLESKSTTACGWVRAQSRGPVQRPACREDAFEENLLKYSPSLPPLLLLLHSSSGHFSKLSGP